MKRFLILCLLLITVPAMFLMAGIAADTTHILDPNQVPLPGSGWAEWTSWGIGALLFLWEVITRLIPTSHDWTIVNKIAGILDWIVTILNGVGNKAKMPNGDNAVFKKTKVRI